MKMTDYDRVKKVILYLDQHQKEQPSLERLAKVAGLSPFHFHRMFTRWAGTTPKDFLQALTLSRAKTRLEQSANVLDAALDVGLSGPGRLHDLFVKLEGVSPGEFKSQGSGLTIDYAFDETPFGFAGIGVTIRGICFLEFVKNEKEGLARLKEKWVRAELSPRPALKKMLRDCFGGSELQMRVCVSGTALQLKVWEALLKIPAGQTVSYQEIAHQIGNPKAVRAVANAIGANPIAYLIPCHRVIRGTGALGGYRWGLERKRAMLACEKGKWLESCDSK